MLMCGYCIQEAKSRGERLFIGDLKVNFDDSVEDNIPCDCCDEYDDLYEVKFSD